MVSHEAQRRVVANVSGERGDKQKLHRRVRKEDVITMWNDIVADANMLALLRHYWLSIP